MTLPDGQRACAALELVFLASSLTTRNENWIEMTGNAPPTLREGQLKEFDDLSL